MIVRLHLASLPDRAGARIAVVDSGIHASHPHVQRIAGGIAFDRDGLAHDDLIDRLGHGTAVAAAIREKAPGAELFAIKVFDRTLATSAIALAAAIEWAAAQRISLINLSLGSSNAEHAAVLTAAVRTAADAGSLIVAAADQEGTRWLPGAIASPSVVAVTLDWNCPREECVAQVEHERLSMRASGWPRPIPGVPAERNLKGISFAVANATGFLARIVGDDDAPAECVRDLFRPPAQG